MTLLKILHYPNPQLRLKAEPVQQVDNEIRTLIDDMFETMYEDNGIGLAAPQLNVQKQVIVIDIANSKAPPLALINPVITERKGEQLGIEGCLSIPNIFEKVNRADSIKVHALDPEGKSIEIAAEGLLASCLQHEIDHLHGTLFIDHLSNLKRNRIIKKIKKLHQKNM